MVVPVQATLRDLPTAIAGNRRRAGRRPERRRVGVQGGQRLVGTSWFVLRLETEQHRCQWQRQKISEDWLESVNLRCNWAGLCPLCMAGPAFPVLV